MSEGGGTGARVEKVAPEAEMARGRPDTRSAQRFAVGVSGAGRSTTHSVDAGAVAQWVVVAGSSGSSPAASRFARHSSQGQIDRRKSKR